MPTAAESASIPTGLQLTPLDPVFRADPYPILAQLRQHAPIHRDDELRAIFFTRHDDVFDVLRNPDYWTDPRKGNPGSFSYDFMGGERDEEPSMLLMDEPDHRRLRGLVRHPFSPRAVERWRERTRGVAERAIHAIPDGEFDLVAKVASPIPTVVIAELLGVDPSRHADFKAWSDTMITTAFNPASEPEALARSEAARVELERCFEGEIERRRQDLGEDLISAMIRAEEAGDKLTPKEIVSLCDLLLLAGNLTTTDLIGNAVMALLRHPDQLATLRREPERMRNAVEEVLRYDSPVIESGRIAHEDLEIGGEKIHRGETLIVSLAAANRDPSAYPDPDRFDIERDDTHHQAFGGGRHFCLGAHLARLEAAETLSVLFERFSVLEFGAGDPVYAANPGFRGLASFPVIGRR